MADANLVVTLTGKGTQLINEFRKVGAAADSAGNQSKSGWDKAKVGIGVAAASIAGGVATIGGMAIKAAVDGEKVHAQLVNAFDAAHVSLSKFLPAVDDASTKMAKFGFENDEVEAAITTLTRATKNPTASIKEMGLAADIARGRNIDLATATQLLVKVQTGHVSLLGRLGINTKDATGKTISQTEALQRLAAMYGGAAQANAQTFAGKSEALSATMKNLEEELGQKLLPVLTQLATILLNGITWLEKHKAAALALGVVIGGVVVAAIVAYTVNMVAAAAATLAAAAPIIAVVAAIGLVVAALVYAWTHWKTFREIVTDVVKGVQTVVKGFVSAIEGVWKRWGDNIVSVVKAAWTLVASTIQGYLTVITGIFDFFRDLFTGKWSNLWNDVQRIVGGAWKTITAIFKFALAVIENALSVGWKTIGNVIQSGVGAVAGFFRDLPGEILSFFAGLPGEMFNLGRDIIMAIVHGIESVAGSIGDAISGAINSIPGGSLITGGLHKLHVPGFATGGIVPGPIGAPQLAIVHGGETITPASAQQPAIARLARGEVNLTINVSAPNFVGDRRDLARTVVEVLQEETRIRGFLPNIRVA